MGKYSNVGPILMAMNTCLLILLFTMNTPSLLIKLANVFAFDFVAIIMISFFIDNEESGGKSIVEKVERGKKWGKGKKKEKQKKGEKIDGKGNKRS